MRLETLVTDDTQRSFVAYIVWMVFDSSKDQLKMKVFFFTVDISHRVRLWLIEHFGPDPVVVSLK